MDEDDLINDVIDAMRTKDIEMLTAVFDRYRYAFWYDSVITEIITEIAPNPVSDVRIFLDAGVGAELYLERIKERLDTETFTGVCRQIPYTESISIRNRLILMEALPESQWCDLQNVSPDNMEMLYHVCLNDPKTGANCLRTILAARGTAMSQHAIHRYVMSSDPEILIERIHAMIQNGYAPDQHIHDIVCDEERFRIIRQHLGWTDDFITIQCTEKVFEWVQTGIPEPSADLIPWIDPVAESGNANLRETVQNWIDARELRIRMY